MLRRIPGPGPISGWFRARDMRAPAREPFRVWWRRTGGGRDGGSPDGGGRDSHDREGGA
jgi:L-lactate dehydrogenase complex protein LldF